MTLQKLHRRYFFEHSYSLQVYIFIMFQITLKMTSD